MKHKTEHIWNEFSSHLRAFIKRSVSDQMIADDILQDVFLRIHSKIDTLQDDSKIRGWVYQITRNAIIDHYRTHYTGGIMPDEIPVCENCDYQTTEDEIASGLRSMAEELPEKYRSAVLLAEFEGRPQTELAAEFGISVSGIKSRVQRGRQMIKDSLMLCCHFEFDRYGTIIDMFPASCCCCCPDSGCGEKNSGGHLLLRRDN